MIGQVTSVNAVPSGDLDRHGYHETGLGKNRSQKSEKTAVKGEKVNNYRRRDGEYKGKSLCPLALPVTSSENGFCTTRWDGAEVARVMRRMYASGVVRTGRVQVGFSP